jgi:hypothetical protein
MVDMLKKILKPYHGLISSTFLCCVYKLLNLIHSLQNMEGDPEQIMAEHIKRVFTPIKPGLQYVRTEDFRDYFEEMEDLDDLSPEMHERAYEEAVKCVDIVQESIMEQLQYDARRFIEEGGEDPGWRSANAGTMKTTLAAFCDLNIGMWEDEFFPQYKEANPEVLDEAGF